MVEGLYLYLDALSQVVELQCSNSHSGGGLDQGHHEGDLDILWLVEAGCGHHPEARWVLLLVRSQPGYMLEVQVLNYGRVDQPAGERIRLTVAHMRLVEVQTG